MKTSLICVPCSFIDVNSKKYMSMDLDEIYAKRNKIEEAGNIPKKIIIDMPEIKIYGIPLEAHSKGGLEIISNAETS